MTGCAVKAIKLQPLAVLHKDPNTVQLQLTEACFDAETC